MYNITKRRDDGFFPKKEKLLLLIKTSRVHNLNAPRKHGILELKDDCAFPIPNPTEYNQGVE